MKLNINLKIKNLMTKQNVTYKVDFQKKRDLLYKFLLCLIV